MQQLHGQLQSWRSKLCTQAMDRYVALAQAEQMV
jgi:hypothetical protein